MTVTLGQMDGSQFLKGPGELLLQQGPLSRVLNQWRGDTAMLLDIVSP